MGELLFSINYQKEAEKLTLVVNKARDLHIEDELAVRGKSMKTCLFEMN